MRATADQGVLVIVVTHDLGLAARFADTVLVLREGRLVSQGAPAEALSEQVMADVFRITRLSRRIRARGRDRAVGGNLMRAAAWHLLPRSRALAMPARARPPRTLPRIVSMNVCTDQVLLTLADPEQILGLSRFSRDAWVEPAMSGAIRCCPAAPRTCWC